MTPKYRDLGLLLLRLGIGVFFMVHGYPKLLGGPEKWQALGSVMQLIGINFLPQAWGLMAGLAEFGGGLCLIAGVAFVPAALAMAATMLMATTMHLSKGDGFNVASHAIELGIVFISLALIGPGRFKLKLSFSS
ncbi:MAG: DoxX family membrane protein [Myxococcales bacterium]|nr:MAG: DoxX family membrane protein [Myxococcales bacterium]